jgi:hypothetical protein
MTFLARHWRGQYRPLVALGPMLALAAAPVAAAVALLWRVGADIHAPAAMAATLGGFNLLLLAAGAWYGVGAWRSLRAWRPVWRWTGRGLLGLAGLAGLGATGLSIWLQAAELRVIWNDDPNWPASSVSLEADGHVARIEGPLRWSVVGRLRSLLDTNPAVRTIRLESPGGRINAGLALFDLIRARGLDTLVTGACASACTDAFLGGRQRWASPDAKLGFHQGALGGETQASIDSSAARIYRRAGVNETFIRRVLTGGQGIWTPSHDELRAAGIVTHTLPPGTNAPPG